ncbi:MAG: 4Fe-4S binding protein [Bacteroidota bacterium]|nr:4Fe-4S binding protein [Bacteroidota bacterium]
MNKILFKPENCIGCGNCVDIAPFYWKMETRDGLAVLIGAKKVLLFDVNIC